MTAVPDDLKFTRDHEWLRLESDGTALVGITDHAQQQLGELVFVELPEPERAVRQGEACAVVESVKAASDVYAPLAGTIVAVNTALESNPALVNTSPYTDGWLFRMKLAERDSGSLLDPDAYRKLIEAAG
jgi:glycine cleavage system H protein